jgi:hypothetical protein
VPARRWGPQSLALTSRRGSPEDYPRRLPRAARFLGETASRRLCGARFACALPGRSPLLRVPFRSSRSRNSVRSVPQTMPSAPYRRLPASIARGPKDLQLPYTFAFPEARRQVLLRGVEQAAGGYLPWLLIRAFQSGPPSGDGSAVVGGRPASCWVPDESLFCSRVSLCSFLAN